ncbi:MAG: DOPA 4,5-dioxygenase family protein [Myxococcota bacterium]
MLGPPRRVHERPIVVHPAPMYQVSFPPEAFGSVVPWLMLNQNGLSILVHAVTEDVMAEHRDWPLWLGERPTCRSSGWRA